MEAKAAENPVVSQSETISNLDQEYCCCKGVKLTKHVTKTYI